MKPLSEGDIEACARDVPAFVAAIAERVLASAPRIVGFSSMGQTLASIAIGREIKRRRADVVTVLGGTNATEPAASGILAITDAFDYVFSGEADVVLPEFCRTYLETGALPYQRAVQLRRYFEELEPYRVTHPLAAWVPFTLLFESPRGCWWG